MNWQHMFEFVCIVLIISVVEAMHCIYNVR